MNKIIIETKAQAEKIVYMKDGRIEQFDVEKRGERIRQGQIYKGIVKRMTPGMDTVIVSLGGENLGYLQEKNITKRLKNKDEILVQVKREAMDGKYPKLTEDLSIAGVYTVLLPKSSGIRMSKKLGTFFETDEIQKETQASLGLILRSSCKERTPEEILSEYRELSEKWADIRERFQRKYDAGLLYEEDFIVRFILNTGILTVDELIFNEAETLRKIRKTFKEKLKIDQVRQVPTDEVLDYCHLSNPLRTLLGKRVEVDGSISLVIEHTEAFTVIDVNSGLQTKYLDFEQNVLAANKKAAEEIARQIRLRDLSGVILIDFIDMKSPSARKELVHSFVRYLGEDRKKTQVFSMTELGILQLVRKKERDSLLNRLTIPCTSCEGSGRTQCL